MASLITVVGFVVLVVNLITVPAEIRSTRPLWWIVSPQVSLVFLIVALSGVTFFFSRLRWVDVALVGLAGVVSIYSTAAPDMTGVVLIFVATGVAAEFGYLARRTRPKLIAVTATTVGLVVSAALQNPATTPGRLASTLIMTAFLAGSGWILVVQRTRLAQERQRELEETVARRTRELSGALAQQKLLLKEIHHRTKNNLQLVASLLSLEYGNGEATSSDALVRAERRLGSLARIHDLLYLSTNTNSTNLQAYLEDYFREISTITDLRGLQLAPEIDLPVDVAVDWAIRVGLIVNEIVINASEHAGSGDEAATLAIRIAHRDQHLVLLAEDNGSGHGADGTSDGGLGIGIIESLAATLDGSATHSLAPGFRWEIRVPLPTASFVDDT